MDVLTVIKPDDFSEEELLKLARQITEVYLEEEGDIWPNDGRYTRTTVDELKKLISNGELIAVINKSDKKIKACIKLFKILNNWYFGMLVTFKPYRNSGYASQLIKYIENITKKNGAKTISIQLLFAYNVHLPFKEYLEKWYAKKGYQFVKSYSIKKIDPEKAGIMKHEAYFKQMTKKL